MPNLKWIFGARISTKANTAWGAYSRGSSSSSDSQRRGPAGKLFTMGALAIPSLLAEVKLPAIISDHMVLQQKQSNRIWGWDTPGTKVTVTLAGQNYSAIATTDRK